MCGFFISILFILLVTSLSKKKTKVHKAHILINLSLTFSPLSLCIAYFPLFSTLESPLHPTQEWCTRPVSSQDCCSGPAGDGTAAGRDTAAGGHHQGQHCWGNHWPLPGRQGSACGVWRGTWWWVSFVRFIGSACMYLMIFNDCFLAKHDHFCCS